MKQKFIEFLNALMDNSPELVNSMMDDELSEYIETLKKTKEKPIITEQGAKILKFIQDNSIKANFKASDLAKEIGIGAKTVSGSLRKLVTDGFIEKKPTEPITYMVTEKGLEFKIK